MKTIVFLMILSLCDHHIHESSKFRRAQTCVGVVVRDTCCCGCSVTQHLPLDFVLRLCIIRAAYQILGTNAKLPTIL